MTIVALDYLDWSVCAGGKHLTGRIIVSQPFRAIELERELTRKEAKENSETQERLWLCDQKTSNRFDTFDQLVRAATKWCESNLTSPWMLLEHTSDDLRKVLASAGVSETRVRTLNLIEAQWDRLTNAQRDNQTMDAFYAAWRAWKP